MAIYPHVFTARHYPFFYFARIWEKLHRVFCRDSALYGVPFKLYRILRRKLFALGDFYHEFNNIK